MAQQRARRTDQRAIADSALALDVMDRYPYGILVQDGRGRLVAHNKAAQRMLGGWVRLAPACEVGCDVLGCHRAAGPLEDVCLHERAREHEGPLPELRIDLPRGADVEAAWVTVAALEPDRELIVTELRPGQRGDRRRRSEPHWTAGPRLRIFALGRTRVLSAESALEGRWLDNRAGHILKFLVAERHRSVYCDEIVERVWPTAGTPDTRGLRYFVHVLRARLEPRGSPNPPSSFVLATRGGYVLDDTHVWIDADAFEELVRAGITARERGDGLTALEHLRRGLELYRGDFLADEPYAEWAFAERERLRALVEKPLRGLAELRLRANDLDTAIGYMERLADMEPFDSGIQRQLITLLLAQGRRSRAIRQYQTFQMRVVRGFGEAPDFQLADLVVDPGSLHLI